MAHIDPLSPHQKAPLWPALSMYRNKEEKTKVFLSLCAGLIHLLVNSGFVFKLIYEHEAEYSA